MAKRRKLTEEDVSQLLEELIDESTATDSNTVGCNDDGRIDCISQAADFESSGDNILDEFSQTEEFMSGQYISEGRVWAGSMVSSSRNHSTGRTSECNSFFLSFFGCAGS